MKSDCLKMRDCLSETIKEMGLTLTHYRRARSFDLFLAAVECAPNAEPSQIAALALSVLCDGSSMNLDAVAILAVLQFLDESLELKKAEIDDPNGVQRMSELIGLIPASRDEFAEWIVEWYHADAG